MVVSASKRAGLGEVTAHRLRHTAATELLRQGAPLHEIGQLLRHRSVLTTAIYAKVDRDRLRELARPWPRVVRHDRARAARSPTTCGSGARSGYKLERAEKLLAPVPGLSRGDAARTG